MRRRRASRLTPPRRSNSQRLSGRTENSLPQVAPVRRLIHSRNPLFTYRVFENRALETITPSSNFRIVGVCPQSFNWEQYSFCPTEFTDAVRPLSPSAGAGKDCERQIALDILLAEE